MKKKTKLKYNNIILLALIILLIVFLVIIINVAKKEFKTNKVAEVKIVDTIDEYGYHLTENNTEYFKKLFKNLQDVLNKDSVDDEMYAKVVSQLFIADFFDLDSKSNKNDVGGVQFVYSDYQNDFIMSAKDVNGLYYHVKSDLYGKRDQELPQVEEVIINKIETDTFESEMVSSDEAYIVDLNITYKKDLGYQDHAIITLIKKDNKLEIVKMEE